MSFRCAIALLATLACACGAGATYTSDPPTDAGADSGEPVCPVNRCTDGLFVCEYCTCAGVVCQHRILDSDVVIIEGTCDENLKCSASCPSALCPGE